MRLTDKFQRVLELTGQNRASFAKKAGVDAAVLSRLIPQDGREPERKATLATILRVISASEGLLTIGDFRSHRATREKPFHFEGLCPLCGHALSEVAEPVQRRRAG